MGILSHPPPPLEQKRQIKEVYLEDESFDCFSCFGAGYFTCPGCLRCASTNTHSITLTITQPYPVTLTNTSTNPRRKGLET